MWKAVIFDDEYIVLKGLQSKIDWASYGIELVGTAGNGTEALELFRKLKPDIVMTDIRMPGRDGLELLEIIMEEAPGTVCIMFSGFNEYEYVRRAIKLGVIDYIEKPITLAKIQEAVRKVARHMEKESDLLEKASLDLLLNGSQAEAKWRQGLGGDAERVAGVTVVALSRRGEEPLPMHPSYRMIPIRHGEEDLILIVHWEQQDDALRKGLSDWGHTVKHTAAGSGRTYAEPSDAALSYREAKRALRYGRFLYETGWTPYEEVAEKGALPGGLTEWEEALVFYLRTGDRQGVMRQLERLEQSMGQAKTEPAMAELQALKWVHLGWEVAKEAGVDGSRMLHLMDWPPSSASDSQTLPMTIDGLRSRMETVLGWIMEARQKTKPHAVERALQYIGQHYGRDISLQEVADHVRINATYLSLLFKDTVGVPYIKYLTKIRMEQAKKLLLEGYSINEVSEKVGYYYYRHFTDVFKKYAGMTPGQYRESCKRP